VIKLDKECVSLLKKARTIAVMIRNLEKIAENVSGDARHYLQNRIKNERAVLDQVEEQAKGLMKDLKPIDYSFITMYYFLGMTIQETSEAIDRTFRQCERIKAAIQRNERSE